MTVNAVPFSKSVRAKFLGASLVLLLIPLSGFIFVRQLESYLRLGQEQVAVATAKLVAASLSDRPGLQLRPITKPIEPTTTEDAPPLKDTERERVLAMFGASDANIASSLGERYVPDARVERILNQSVAKDARVWVVDLAGNVRGLAGAIYANSTADKSQGEFAGRLAAGMRWLLNAKLSVTSSDVIDSRDAVLAQAERALLGQSNNEWRAQQDDRIAVVSAAEPIWQADSIVGAVIVEASDTSQRSLASRAAQSVIVVSVLVFVLAFSMLVWFAFGLSRRITRLQQDANAAVDGQGRATGTIKATGDTDEIGALSRTLAAMVARQASYNHYLEQLAGRLSHELRTPVAVVRSSLDNLRTANLGDDELKYLSRADEGVARLSSLISRMAEATQLERMLQGADQESFDLRALVDGCVEGYRLAFPAQSFSFLSTCEDSRMTGVPDALAQMLDKLVQNAVDFAVSGTTIDITLSETDGGIKLTVSNSGPLLPADTSSLFESMISIRHGGQEGEHLGLGLYIARLIAEFHLGRISASNRPDRSGVVMQVVLPLARG